MFEMVEEPKCGNCKWWEPEFKKKKKNIGICQCYDQHKKDVQRCCRHEPLYKGIEYRKVIR